MATESPKSASTPHTTRSFAPSQVEPCLSIPVGFAIHTHLHLRITAVVEAGGRLYHWEDYVTTTNQLRIHYEWVPIKLITASALTPPPSPLVQTRQHCPSPSPSASQELNPQTWPSKTLTSLYTLCRHLSVLQQEKAPRGQQLDGKHFAPGAPSLSKVQQDRRNPDPLAHRPTCQRATA